MTPRRDRLVRDVLLDVTGSQPVTDLIVEELGINPLGDTLGDLEAGRVVLAWAREGRDVNLSALLVRDGDEDAISTGVDVSSPVDPDEPLTYFRPGACVPEADTPTLAVLLAADLMGRPS